MAQPSFVSLRTAGYRPGQVEPDTPKTHQNSLNRSLCAQRAYAYQGCCSAPANLRLRSLPAIGFQIEDEQRKFNKRKFANGQPIYTPRGLNVKKI